LFNRILPKDTVSGARKLDLADLEQGGGAVLQPAAEPSPGGPVVDAQTLARAREEAYREGVAAGRSQAHAAADDERAQLKALIGSLNELVQGFEQTLADDVMGMSLELAKQIVRQTLKVKPDLVMAVVREAVSSLPGLTEQSVLVLNPADVVLVRQAIDDDATLASLPWRIVEDPQLERGGCRLETASTEVDGGLETRWRRVLAALGRDDVWIDITT